MLGGTLRHEIFGSANPLGEHIRVGGERDRIVGVMESKGQVLGIRGAQLLTVAVPELPVHTPWVYVFIAESLALIITTIAGVVPARRAAQLDPVEALRAE